MHSKITVVYVVLVTVVSISCEQIREKRARRKNVDYPEKALWKKEYENELTDAMLSTRRRENLTRVPQSSPMSDNEAVVEKLMDSITSSEKYLKKVDSIDFRLNRLDIEVHEKSNGIMKQLSDIMKTIMTDNCAEKLEPSLHNLRSDINHIKFALDKSSSQRTSPNIDGGDYHNDASLDSRFTFLENHVKSIQTGVDSIVATISEVKSRQFGRPYSGGTSTRSDVGGSIDAMALIAEFRKTIRDHKTTRKCECKSTSNNRVDRSERYPTDCHEIQMQGFNVSGIYKIRPDDMDPFYVLCDLTTAGGGWTVFQNRFDGSQDFLKGWNDYEYGFGNLAGEFWLGLDKLNYLTNQKLYELRIEMETQRGQEAYAGYSVFTVGPEQEGYRISTLGTFYGTAGDSLSYHAGQKFSTIDMDNDEWKDGACATEHGGAWWYKECDKSNLNGKYTQPGEENRGQSMYWISFKGPNSPLSKTKMMIRPLPASKPVDYTEAKRTVLEGSKLNDLSHNDGVAPDRLDVSLDKIDTSGQYGIKNEGYEISPYSNYEPTGVSKTLFTSYL